MNAARVSLASLLEGIAPAPPLAVTGLALDGREVTEGGAYVALQGSRAHGLQYLGQALESGARAVLWDPGEVAAPPALPGGIASVPVPQLRDELGTIADRFHRAPSLELSVAGVTGTNGKTTCAWLLAGVMGRLQRRGAYLGTLGSGFPPALGPGGLTTPDVLTLHRQLRELADLGASHVAMEVSSHALDQQRVAAVRFGVAAFTNLTRDHLEYHGSMERYQAAKQRLFTMPGLRHAVINTGDPAGRAFAESLPESVTLTAVCVGAVAPAAQRWIQVGGTAQSEAGLVLEVAGHFGQRRVATPLVGEFNAENLAVVLGVLLAWDVDIDAACAALAACQPPPGRMEAFRLASGALAIVDYAHTPDALAKVLAAARGHARGRLGVVFGCGGDRDAGKRPLMARVAESLADQLWITDDNPRSEDPAAIVAMIVAGLAEPRRARVEHDRAVAIRAALAAAGPGDVVVIAGKGHEDTQQRGAETLRFSDRDCVRALAGGLQ